jgi:hypothetical protein
MDLLPDTPTALPTGGLRALLRRLGAADEFGNPAPARTGCLVITDSAASNGSIYLRSGRIYAAQLSGFTPPVALRLLSGGHLSDQQYHELSGLPPETAGQTAVALGYAPADAVEDIHRQMLLSTLTHMYAWATARWHWQETTGTDAFTIAALDANLALAATDERLGQWEALARNYPAVTKGNAIPEPGPDWSAKEGESTSPEIAAILTYVDGTTTIAQIAAVCGFARFEIAARLAKAISDGILIIADPDAPPATDDASDTADSSWLDELDEAKNAVDYARKQLAAAEERLARAQAITQAST